MLDYILKTAQTFERQHGIAPDVIYINPLHYERLTRCNPELFVPGSRLCPGFRLVIVPASILAHPHASLLDRPHTWSSVAATTGRGANTVAGGCRGGKAPAG
jgi:hypothetical protein